MDRRTFVGTLTAGLLVAPLAAEAQQAQRVPKIGVLTMSVTSSMAAFEGFRQGLREHGYVEGQNIVLELRFAQGRPERLAAMAGAGELRDNAGLTGCPCGRAERTGRTERIAGPGRQGCVRNDSRCYGRDW